MSPIGGGGKTNKGPWGVQFRLGLLRPQGFVYAKPNYKKGRAPLMMSRLSSSWLRAAVAVVVGGAMVQAQAVTETEVTYEAGGVQFLGRLFVPDDATSQSPRVAVVVFPEWWGNNEYSQGRARDLAKEGFIALAADLYGNGTLANDRQEAAGLAMPLFSNRPLLRDRALAAVEVLRNHPLVNPEKVVSMGYCLGGATSLELARIGAPITAAVSFHGSLNFPDPITSGTRTIPVLIFNGEDDPAIPVQAVQQAEKDFREAGFEVTVVQYPGVVHSFTVPAAGSDKSTGAAYDEQADKDSHRRLMRLLRNIRDER